jgi:hypothetical protein
MSVTQFNGVKIFSATMAHERETLGEKVTSWFVKNPDFEIHEIETMQSSDNAFHCITILVYFSDPLV